MFRIYADDKPLWVPGEADKRLINPVVNLEVNKVGSSTFKLLPGHPYYSNIVKMQTIITIEQDHRTIFRGRVYSTSEDFYKTKTVTCEGVMAYLNDSIVRKYSFKGSPKDYLTFLIEQHNNQVAPHQRFELGKVTVTDNNDYISRASSENPNTWQEINSKLINILGGYIVIRYEEDGNYIDYLKDFEDTSTQDIAFSVNLLDIKSEASSSNIATCIIPYGAKNEETGENLDITSVNDGKDYIEDEEAVARYGRICVVEHWEDVTSPNNLLKKAKAFLANKVLISNKLTVKAIDLHLADETIEGFKLGDYIQVYSEPHEIDERVLLTAYSISLADPAQSTITLGIERKSYIADKVKESLSKDKNIEAKIDEGIEKRTNNVIAQTQEYINQQISNERQQTSEILENYVTIQEHSKNMSAISTQVSQTSKEVDIKFKTVSERVDTDTQETYRRLEVIEKFLRVVDGEVYLGESGNTLTTRIANGRISFIYNGSLEVAYISENKLYITEAEVIDRIIIGKYAFIPRTNGNLSFKKI